MRPGSVIVDLAVEQGGNVEARSRARWSSATASRSSATATCRAASPRTPRRCTRNLYNFLSAFWDGEAKTVKLPDEDEIVQGVRLTHGGKVVSQRLLG